MEKIRYKGFTIVTGPWDSQSQDGRYTWEVYHKNDCLSEASFSQEYFSEEDAIEAAKKEIDSDYFQDVFRCLNDDDEAQ